MLTGLQLPTENRDALAHPNEAVSGAAALVDARAVAVVGHADLDLVVAVAERHTRVSGVRVLECVSKRLLHDPEAREVDRRPHPLALALDLEVHVEAGRSGALEERSEEHTSEL